MQPTQRTEGTLYVKFATNINQMAKHCNESKWFGNVDVLKMTRALEEVLKLLKQLVERWR